MPFELLKPDEDWLLTLSGDIFEAAELQAAALETVHGAAGAVVVDLDSLDEHDVATVQVLLALQRALVRDGRAVRFQNAGPAIVDTWRLAGVKDSLE